MTGILGAGAAFRSDARSYRTEGLMAGKSLTKRQIESGLRELAQRARKDGKLFEISVYGGSAIVLAYDFRAATRDVDVVISGDASVLRRYAAEIAESRDWDRNWLNDSVKGFVSAQSSKGMRFFRSYPDEKQPGLRVMVPTPEYLLAMKCMAMRIDAADAASDLTDIHNLMRITKRTTYEQVIEAVQQFYPAKQISPRTDFGIQQIVVEFSKAKKKQAADELPTSKKPRRRGKAR